MLPPREPYVLIHGAITGESTRQVVKNIFEPVWGLSLSTQDAKELHCFTFVSRPLYFRTVIILSFMSFVLRHL